MCVCMFNISVLLTKCICVEDTARGHLPRMELKPEVKRPFKGPKECSEREQEGEREREGC